MDINLNEINLKKIKVEIVKLLKRRKNGLDDLEQMWFLMDLVWDDFLCDNRNLDWEKIGKFYSHPVWLLNGLFIEQHEVSMGHRNAISQWIYKNKFKNVVDYGGGFGTLARLIAKKNQKINTSIYEPYPSEFGLKRAEEFNNILFIKKLDKDYDCLVATDVLEHVKDPLRNLITMINSVKINGYLVIANCFFPVIKCHLPQVFHFRYSFNLFAKIMGLEIIGVLKGSHATIYRKSKEVEPNWKYIRFLEKISQKAFPIIEFFKTILRPLKFSKLLKF